jgi:hypothetical protein
MAGIVDSMEEVLHVTNWLAFLCGLLQEFWWDPWKDLVWIACHSRFCSFWLCQKMGWWCLLKNITTRHYRSLSK